MKKDEVDTPP